MNERVSPTDSEIIRNVVVIMVTIACVDQIAFKGAVREYLCRLMMERITKADLK